MLIRCSQTWQWMLCKRGGGVHHMLDQKDRPSIIIGADDNTSHVMTSVEAAEYLKMHVKTVCRLAKEGKIPAKKVGSEWRFLRSVLDGWLAETMV